MPLNTMTISIEEATHVAQEIITKAKADGGSPVAVAIVDSAGRLKAFLAMDHVVPASIKLAQSKAYSAVLGQKDTLHWASFSKNDTCVDFDMRNWTDENFTGFTGGILLFTDHAVIGGIGVSGRKGMMGSSDTIAQDNELAQYGKEIIDELILQNGI